MGAAAAFGAGQAGAIYILNQGVTTQGYVIIHSSPYVVDIPSEGNMALSIAAPVGPPISKPRSKDRTMNVFLMSLQQTRTIG